MYFNKLVKRILYITVLTLGLFAGPVKAVNTYYWIGTGFNSNWTTSGNWIKNNTITGITTSYPGSGVGDIAVFQALSFTANVTLNSAVNTLGSVILADAENANVNISSGTTLSVTGGVTIATALQILGTTSTLTLNGAGTLSLNGASIFNNGALLNVNAGSLLFNSGSSITINGSSNAQSVLQCAGGNITANTAIFNLSGGLSQIKISSGSFLPTTCIFNISGTTSQLWNTGGTITTSGCTFNISGGLTTGQATGVPNDGGIFNANTTVFNLTATGTEIKNLATFNLGNGSAINMTGTGTFTRNGTAGIFTCSPTSVININTSTSYLQNTSTNPFTLLSSAAGSATIGNITAGGAVTGLYNVQRFVTGANNSIYRNYRLLSCPVNKITYVAPTTAANVIDLTYLGASVSSPATFNGAFIAGPGTTFGTGIHSIANPLIYLYQEAITPGTSYNSTFTSGKNVGVVAIGGAAPNYNISTLSTAAGGLTSTSVKVPVGNGYLLYYIGDNTRTTLAPTTKPGDSYITATGYINQGTIPVYIWGSSPTNALTYTSGTNSRFPGLTMVGNPYPSTINLYQLYQDNATGVSATFYQLSDLDQSFPSYNAASTGASTAGGTQYVASGQGFYVNVLAAGTKRLTFYEGDKAPSATAAVFPSPTYLSVTPPAPIKSNNAMVAAGVTKSVLTQTAVASTEDEPAPAILGSNNLSAPAPKNTAAPITPGLLHLKLMRDSITHDECGIYFNKTWSDNFDLYDSNYMDGLAPKVYMGSFTADNVLTGVNALGDYTKGKKIKLYVRAVTDGAYNLQLEDIKNIDTSLFRVYLVDHQLSDSVDMLSVQSYPFNITAADTSAFSNRFTLDIELKPLPPYRLMSFLGQKVPAGVQLNWKTVNEGNYTAFVLQKLTDDGYTDLDSVKSTGSSGYSFVDPHPILGNNIYRLQQTGITGAIKYSADITISYNSTSPNGNLTIYPNPSKTIINLSLSSSSTASANYTADIYNLSGSKIGQTSISASSWTQDISTYKLGVYLIKVKDASGNIVGQSKFIKEN